MFRIGVFSSVECDSSFDRVVGILLYRVIPQTSGCFEIPLRYRVILQHDERSEPHPAGLKSSNGMTAMALSGAVPASTRRGRSVSLDGRQKGRKYERKKGRPSFLPRATIRREGAESTERRRVSPASAQ
jgi:hypothetical protein